MAVSFKYWDDCVDPPDMDAMWMNAEVSTEWNDAGENRGQKVHLSRDPDGQPFLTQTEMRAVAGIIVSRHFDSQIDPDMICAVAELESDRQPLAERYNRKTKETTMGIMQLLPKTVDWMVSELGYRTYEVEGNPTLLYRPFVNVYLGSAYLKWLSNYEQKERSEEFVVRSYKGGAKKATHKSTLPYWRRYLSVKESLPSRKVFEDGPVLNNSSASSAQPAPVSRNEGEGAGVVYTYWDSRASPEDMEEMWNNPDVTREWTKSGERRGKVRFSHDAKKRPYLSRVEVKAVAEIILSKHFSTRGVKPTVLCALAEIVSMRFINGAGPRIGVMGIDYSTALWLYKDLGYNAYRIESVDDLGKPFISMYFGAAYMAWLSEYEGRERTPEFVVQAYLGGPENVSLQETGPLWLKFEEALLGYEEIKREQGSCSIL
ncbi:uncharacterized protein LOC131145098 isoform X1 [Malania oleifera]|uniref:uncharacterized protein LOC131145098 isoform X1 n=2 Tax=Malania oleifera TaxID=397392 RepID=UPI0025AE9AAA|nr:uncharacterized protein LOC131145098 isoform X1 [Malania oleifera]XP_057950160.1 uncharacterized protein LOC131145098 isoform X1 [Malania oleifera]